MVESLIQIKIRITINVDASSKNIYVKKIIFGVQLHVVEKFVYNLASIIEDSVITCDEIIEETKTIPTNFNEKHII